jgi:Holliday junction DNA helicase RuvB
MSTDNALRPNDWDSYVGQEKLKNRLQVSIDGALERYASLDHVLLHGPPGCGKTSIASLIAQEMVQDFHSYVMPVKVKSLQKIFLENEGVIFLDEIHRLSRKDQEFLLPVLEDHDIQFDNGKKIHIDHQFTVVGATTELEKIIKPLRDRFIHRPKFEEYTDEEMATIVKRMSDRIGMDITNDECLALGRASAGVPRQARTIVYTARDLNSCNPDLVLETCGITHDGLTEDHLEYLLALNKMGQIAGVDVLSNYTGLPKDVILDLEKLLVRKSLIEYSPKGRLLMVKGMQLLNQIDSPDSPATVVEDDDDRSDDDLMNFNW